ncbi:MULTISPECIES: DUF983 domain-containing protein [Tenacibaculum]|uniref:DUF983 domain-containing protein n=1 Tax=Tenacibaculum TaxID=104267 RepID=UPI001F0ABF70|nr:MULTISPECIES: DUF983 domain-containing protein [Tenacibaculum]MCH3880756.1 DUF983 domain-containing protein [Tenacibaculum aquimarinum]MCH3884363.1 DUF983 domain-containing protein [Tenacibaculum aquimarinum]MDO6599645.1 DUF983 domain-containing protein [Tenacibaculum sp. 1_MG-2023]
MFKKGTKLYSIFTGKCPHCHEGKFFKYPFTIKPSKILKIYDNCEVCNQKYMLEPSFYYGAMYVNYGLSVATFVAVFIIAKVLLGLTILESFIAIIVVSILLTPFCLRLSRIIWINIFVHYKKKK